MTSGRVVAGTGLDHAGDPDGADAVEEPGRVGRKRDPSRDTAILEAATEVLGEVGYVGLTMDLVAARAGAGKATVYRRWSSKDELVLDVVDRIVRGQVRLDALPDTGTIRGDLLALFRPEADEEVERRMKAVAGLASMLSHRSVFAEAAQDALVEPWAAAHRLLMRRAVERGELPPSVDVETICQVLPTLAAYRTLVQRAPFTWEFLRSAVDVVILPALFDDPSTRLA